jgi:hypothetical protein
VTISPPTTTPATAPCTIVGTLTGTWTDARMTSLGPAWVRLDLRGNCEFTYRIQLLWMRIAEHGVYKIAGDRLVLTRRTSTTTWPYELVGRELHLTEAQNETYVMTRSVS